MKKAEALISVSNLSKNFLMGGVVVQALQSISTEIPEGGIVALMGPSGSGKSTLLNLIGALDSPSSGYISVRGIDIAKLDSDKRAEFRNSSVGFIFQNFNLIPVLTPIENIMLPKQLSGQKNNKDDERRAHSLLEKVGLTKQANQSVNRLSGGQMQRVAIARALMNKPPIILADEPTANLDHVTADAVLKLLKETSTSEGATVIIATHDQAVLPFCSRIIQLRDGMMVSDQKS